jgi:M6 family metalloprotease-like protein
MHTPARRIAALCALLFSFALLVPPARALAATGNEYDSVANAVYDASATHGQLALFVTFQGDASTLSATALYDGQNLQYGTSGQTRWQKLASRIDGMDTGIRTFRSYLYTISSGACNVKTYFPQTAADGTCTELVLPRAVSAYVGNDDLLMADVTAACNRAFPSYDASAADKDNDGYIDNVLVIANSSGYFTSHANATTVATRIGGKGVSSMTVLEGLVYQTGSSVSDAFSESTAVHEFMHRLGAADLYRNSSKSSGGTPVGVWDVMASGAAYSWPLAYTRQVVGWDTLGSVDLDALDTQDTFTLSAHEGLKLVTSRSTSEYLVMEYRKDTTDVSGYDRYTGASGLVVYRVNEAYADQGNIYGKDYVYVFRPGETSLTASAGNVYLAPIATTAYATSRYGAGVALNQTIGSLDPSATFDKGTIFFSDGTNSGIRITAVAQTDDSITVKVETAAAEQGDYWTKVGASSDFSAGSNPSTQVVAGDGDLYVLVGGGGTFSVRRFHDGAWSELGSLGSGNGAAIAWHDGSLWATVATSSGSRVMRFSNGAWTAVGTVGSGYVMYPDIASIGGNLYVLTDTSGANTGVYRLDGSLFVQAGSALPYKQACNSKLTQVGGAPAVVAGDTGGSAWSTYLCVYKDGAWTKLCDVNSTAANSISCAVKDGVTYVYTGSSSKYYETRIDAAGTATSTEVTSSLKAITQGMTLTAGESNLYVAGVDGSGNLTVYACAWGTHAYEQLGSVVFTGASQASVTSVGSSVYVATATTSGQVVVRTHGMASGDTSADAPNQNVGTYAMPLTVSDIADVKYDGAEHRFVPVVTNEFGELLSKDVDFTVSYAGDTVNAGTVTVTVAGIGSYGGAKQVSYRILPRSVTLTSAGATKDYDGTALVKPGVTVSGDGFVNGEATAEAVGTITNAGQTTNTIQVKESTGYRAANYSISKNEGTLTVRGCTFTIAGVPDVKYDGADHRVTPKVTGSDGRTLVAGTDFTVSWSGDVRNAGTVTVTIAGKGGYQGTASTSYRILKRSVTLTSQSASKTYDGRALASTAVTVSDDGFVSGEATVKATGSITSPGSVANTIVVSGSYKASNYDISKNEGTLTVAAPANSDVAYRTHVQNVGWQNWVRNGSVAGTSGRALRLEGINIKLENAPYAGGITYRTHIQNVGWQEWKSDGAMSGTSGRALRLEAIQIKLTGKMAEEYDVYYRVHAQNVGWMGWAKNGEAAGTAGYAYRLEAIEIKVVKKGSAAPGSTANAFIGKMVQYTSHVQNIGWQGYVSQGGTSGTSGRALRLEGMRIKLVNTPYSGGIEYRTHVQNIGWQGWTGNDAMTGTSGRALRLEAISIRLTGEMAEHFHVYYRVHAQNFGWMGWAKNGQDAGTAGYAYRLEAIQIVLVPKGTPAPGTTVNAFRQK